MWKKDITKKRLEKLSNLTKKKKRKPTHLVQHLSLISSSVY